MILSGKSYLLFLLNIISAVDAHVGNFILKECFVNYLKNKTRVLVTHKFETLKYVDYIYIFKKGRIVEEGTLETLKDTLLFHEIEEKYKTNGKSDNKKEDLEETSIPKEEENKFEDNTSAEPIEELASKEEMPSEKNPTKEEIEKMTEEEDKALTDKLMLDEDREIGSVEWKVWKSYFNYYGGWFYFSLIFLGNGYTFQISNLISYVNFHHFEHCVKLLAFVLE